MAIAFSIHQFSSGIINPTRNRDDQWVARGFGKEIENESFAVPEEIRTAVDIKDGFRLFKIPDAWPPKRGNIALIARELNNYCVLAVANLQEDETGTRQFVGYRYFWLDKKLFQNTPDFANFDGIGTLLWYWQENGKPTFNIGEFQLDRNLYMKSWDGLLQKKLFEHSEQYAQRIKSLIDRIGQGNQPLVYESVQNSIALSQDEIHLLAIKYSRANNCKISWAWNVQRLENWEKLNVIYCADSNALNWFSQQLSKYVPTPQPTPIPDPIPTPFIQGRTDPRKCLLKFRGAFEPTDVLELMNYCQSYKERIVEFQDKGAIRSFSTEPNPPEHFIRYAALLTALNIEKNSTILSQLMKLDDNLKKTVAIKFLMEVEEIAIKDSRCRNHPVFPEFYRNFLHIEYVLFGSLNKKPPFFSFPGSIPFFNWPLILIFFLLLGGGFIYLKFFNTSKLLSTTSNNAGSTSPSQTPPPTFSDQPLTELLNKYEREYQNPNSELVHLLTQEITKRLKDSEKIFEQLESTNSNDVQNSRKTQIYIELKKFIPDKPDKLPNLQPSKNDNRGDKSNIIALQNILKRGRYNKDQELTPGVFDEKTINAVKNAQTAYNNNNNSKNKKIGEDGQVGELTWKILIGRLQDLQIEMVYKTLMKHLPNGDLKFNIVTEIKNCQKDENPLKFVKCLEQIQ